MTPMIDVTFLLLIFFMCTLNFKALEGILQAYLPKEDGQSKAFIDKEPEEPITVKLLKEQQETFIWVGDVKLSGADRYKQLYTKIRYIIAKTPNTSVIIDPDIDIPFQEVISTLNVCRKIDQERGGKPIPVKFTTLPEESG